MSHWILQSIPLIGRSLERAALTSLLARHNERLSGVVLETLASYINARTRLSRHSLGSTNVHHVAAPNTGHVRYPRQFYVICLLWGR
jgi:hypothetical protein